MCAVSLLLITDNRTNTSRFITTLEWDNAGTSSIEGSASAIEREKDFLKSACGAGVPIESPQGTQSRVGWGVHPLEGGLAARMWSTTLEKVSSWVWLLERQMMFVVAHTPCARGCGIKRKHASTNVLSLIEHVLTRFACRRNQDQDHLAL